MALGEEEGEGAERRGERKEKKIFYFSWWKNLSKGQKGGGGGRRRQLVFVQNLETTCLVFVSFSCTRLLLLTIRFSDLAHFPKKRKERTASDAWIPLIFPTKKEGCLCQCTQEGGEAQ